MNPLDSILSPIKAKLSIILTTAIVVLILCGIGYHYSVVNGYKSTISTLTTEKEKLTKDNITLKGNQVELLATIDARNVEIKNLNDTLSKKEAEYKKFMRQAAEDRYTGKVRDVIVYKGDDSYDSLKELLLKVRELKYPYDFEK